MNYNEFTNLFIKKLFLLSHQFWMKSKKERKNRYDPLRSDHTVNETFDYYKEKFSKK